MAYILIMGYILGLGSRLGSLDLIGWVLFVKLEPHDPFMYPEGPRL